MQNSRYDILFSNMDKLKHLIKDSNDSAKFPDLRMEEMRRDKIHNLSCKIFKSRLSKKQKENNYILFRDAALNWINWQEDFAVN